MKTNERMQLQKTTEPTTSITSLPSLPTTLQRLADPRTFHEILATAPVKLEKVLECPPISALIHAGAHKSSIEAVLAIEITKASQMLTVGGNLRQGQSLEIAKELIRANPHESIEDFCYCLRNGVKGKYNDPGKLFRFDVLVINEWFEKYLDEKYQKQEELLMKEKDRIHETVKKSSTDWLHLMQEAVKKTDEEGKTPTVPQSKVFMQKVMDLTEKEIDIEGQDKPKKQGYPSTSLSEIEVRLRHIEYIKQNYDARTAEKLPTWMSEEEWTKRQLEK